MRIGCDFNGATGLYYRLPVNIIFDETWYLICKSVEVKKGLLAWFLHREQCNRYMIAFSMILNE
ncbi:hypothetical protein [Mucilaginibacter sp.]|jgi:hypothetical protein|uniref:hypothetical protein n=1 Tax=Mucilaginibacter sp. TaxID=1882438 RepID=UPI0035650AE8